MAKGHLEKVKLYNLSADDLIRLGRVFQHVSPAVKTLYYETRECSSIIALASLGLKPESLIVRNEDPRGPPIGPVYVALMLILDPTLRALSLHRSSDTSINWWRFASRLRHLTYLTVTGSGSPDICLFTYITTIEEIILDFKDGFFGQDETQITRTDIFLPSLRVFKLRHVLCPTAIGLPTFSFYAPMLRTFHLDSASAAHWLFAFSVRGAPAALVDFRVDRPNGLALGLPNLQPFLCDTIESIALTSISHALDPLLSDIEAGLILPRRKHLEFTFHDE